MEIVHAIVGALLAEIRVDIHLDHVVHPGICRSGIVDQHVVGHVDQQIQVVRIPQTLPCSPQIDRPRDVADRHVPDHVQRRCGPDIVHVSIDYRKEGRIRNGRIVPCGHDVSGKLRSTPRRIRCCRRDGVAGGGSHTREHDAEAGIPAAVRSHRLGTKVDFSFTVIRWVADGTGIEVDFDCRVRRAVDRSVNNDLAGRHDRQVQRRVVLQVVCASVTVTRVVRRDTVGAEIDSDAAVIVDRISTDFVCGPLFDRHAGVLVVRDGVPSTTDDIANRVPAAVRNPDSRSCVAQVETSGTVRADRIAQHRITGRGRTVDPNTILAVARYDIA